MSLPVGTMVLVVRTKYSPHMLGAVGEIVEPLALRTTRHSTKPVPCYLVRFPGRAWGPLKKDTWCCPPSHLVPITPPGQTDDVTQDEPIEEEA